MDLKQYIAESSRSYRYRIKTVVPLDNDEMDKIERALAKYKPLDITRPRKTLLQSHPLDFINIENAEVYLIDVETGLPASSYVLQQEIRNVLNCPEKYIVVRAPNEPIELEGGHIDAEREMDAEAKAQSLQRKAMLGVAANYDENEQTPDGENFYGNAYNTKLLGYLRQVQQSRAPEKCDAADPLFGWIEMPKDSGEPKQVEGDFNAAMDGVKPASTRNAGNAKQPDAHARSGQGNFDDTGNTYSRNYMSRTLSRTVDAKEPK